VYASPTNAFAAITSTYEATITSASSVFFSVSSARIVGSASMAMNPTSMITLASTK
jgi:hypothetical protein